MDNETGSSPQSSVSYVTPLLISLIGIASSSLAIILYHLILIKFCLRPDQQEAQESNANDTGPQDEVGRSQWDMGLDEDILNSIPIFSYTNQKAKLLRVDQSGCIICLGELEHGDTVRLLPTCRHAFHVPCIDKWFTQHSRCPLCRCSVLVPALAPEFCAVSLPPESDHGGDCVLDLSEDDNDQLHIQQRNGDPNASCSSSSGMDLLVASGLLKHSVSLKLPRDEEQPEAQVTCLKRSWSMDQSYYIARVDMQRDREKACSSSLTSSKEELVLQNKPHETAKSTRTFDRVSHMLVRSFSQIRNSRSTAPSAVLPV